MTYVKWWETIGKTTKVKGYICFSSMARASTRIRYLAYVNHSITGKEAIAYAEMLKEFLPGTWTHSKLIKVESKRFNPDMQHHHTPTGKGRYIRFDILTKGMSKHLAMMYLTGFRYLDEYPDYVKKGAKLKGTSEEKFVEFLRLQGHHSGHGWLGKYYGSINKGNSFKQGDEPITLKTFHKNIADPEVASVYGFFGNHET